MVYLSAMLSNRENLGSGLRGAGWFTLRLLPFLAVLVLTLGRFVRGLAKCERGVLTLISGHAN